MSETERRKAAEELKTRATNFCDTLDPYELGMFGVMAAFAAKEVERATDSALLEAAGLVCQACKDSDIWRKPVEMNAKGNWIHYSNAAPLKNQEHEFTVKCKAGPIHERRAQKGNG